MSYEKPIMEIIYFEPIDVITGSITDGTGEEGNVTLDENEGTDTTSLQ